MMGLGCFDASNGAPGGGVCPNVRVELNRPAAKTIRKLRERNIRDIIIDPVEAIVRALFIKPEKGSSSMPLRSVNVVFGGLEGDHHTGSSRRRHILLLSANVLDELNLQPGALYENVLIDGIDVMALEEGQEFQLGEALVAVTIPCEPCIQMERVRGGLRQVLQNRRGMFVKVLVPGTVRVGDRLTPR
jgi:hypothetical protein